jgi:mercuric ion binding protein
MKPLLVFIVTALLLAGTAFAKDVTTEIKVSGMTCEACAVSVQKALEKTKGVKRAEVTSEKGLATVTYDDAQVNQEQLRTAIDKTGFKAEPAKGQK